MRNRLCQVAVTAAVLMLLMGGESFAAKRETKNEKSDTPGTPVPSAEEKAAAAAAAKAAKEAARKERGKKAGEDSVGPAGNDLLVHLQTFNPAAMRRAIADLAAAFGPRYPKAAEFLARLDRFEKALPGILEGVRKKDAAALKAAQEVLDFQREAMLANPLLDFDKLLLVRRKGAVEHGLPANWQGNCVLPRKGFDNEIAILSPVRPDGKLTTAYKPANESFVGDVDLHWDARKMLFSQVGRNDRWQIHEVNLDGAGLREITRGKIAEFDNYDPVYLPDDRIIFASASVFHGVPCVGGKTPVVNLFRMDADGENVRQLCFDQDHDWTPAVLNDGRVMYTRWEYADTPHYFTRLLFRMNPDGTGQMEYYGSNSFWPNSMFYARPVPGHPTMVAAIISGHHGVKRYGELLLFDPARGRQEARGVVQRIPGFGKPVEPVIKDRLVDGVFPRFLHPFPLSEKYLLVSAQLANNMPWGVYLVDVFDNMTLVKNLPGHALLEPLPLRKTPRPPVIVDRVDLDRKDAIVYLTDVYKGPGLAGVPRGSVRNLRVFEYHYAYNGVGGHNQVAVEGGWEVKRILGTVPVEPDGSASFRVPANTPLAVQPLDEKGQALQLMRSWFTAMPGEILSCVGCHEKQNDAAPNMRATALTRAPSEIAPWYGPVRGFSFPRDVQPVLDKYCVGCHDGKNPKVPNFSAHGSTDVAAKKKTSGFTSSYLALHPYVRRPGPESDYHILVPAEYCANTSELIQMLRKGHRGVKLDAEAWDRLITWIDLNVPDFGTWTEQTGGKGPGQYHELRLDLRKLYANVSEDPEAIPRQADKPVSFIRPAAAPAPSRAVPSVPGWPFDAAEARRRQQQTAPQTAATADLGGGVKMTLRLIPAGEFVIGDPAGNPDELPPCRVKISQPFWMAATEVTNAQFGRFDPAHDSRYIDQQWKDHTLPGYPANQPDQPVIRVSWEQATAFCRWLSERTGRSFALPSEVQWEYAARAGANTALSYGGLEADFSKHANMADASIKLLAVQGVNPQPVSNPSVAQDFLPRDTRFNDGQKIVCEVGKYAPNAWGLFDMHGNVAEWTRSIYRPYPYADDARNDPAAVGERVVRGGSWMDRPAQCRSAFRLSYPQWQKVYNVGFRVVCPAAPAAQVAGK